MNEIRGKETKIFDPAEGFAPLTDALVVTDSTVVKRGNQWWMYLAGKRNDKSAIHLFSASLPEGAPLAATGWTSTPDREDSTKIGLLAQYDVSRAWDLEGGRHCPSYVKGWDPQRNAWVERIYYAGGAEHVWGPYTIGYLEWNGHEWAQQPEPCFVANEDWEHGTVYEPNLIYADGKWKLWYVCGSFGESYLAHGFAESADGRSNWTRKMFFPPEEGVFDFCPIETQAGYEAVFTRLPYPGGPTAERGGLWWCEAKTPASEISAWSEPVQIMTVENRGWHTAPWKPSFRYGEIDPNKMFVFFDGQRSEGEPGWFPYQFTLGCLEISRPRLRR